MPRLSKIYTRTGDKGTTGLATGERVAKTHPRVVAMGDIDELNSCIGLLRSQALPEGIDAILAVIQHRLFDIGGELAMPGHAFAQDAWVKRLEQQLDNLNAELPELAEFILPAGSAATAHCHLARSVCRRAERALLCLADAEAVNSAALKYLNRLSDLLFVMARVIARADGGQEVYWQKGIE